MKEALKWLKCTKKTGRLRMIAMDCLDDYKTCL